MRILVLSNFPATPRHPNVGVFVRERVRCLRELGHDVQLRTLFPVPVPSLPYLPSKGDAGWPGRPPSPDLMNLVIPVSAPKFVAGAALTSPRSVCLEMAQSVLDTIDGDVHLVVSHGAYRLPAAGVASHVAQYLGRPYVTVAHGSDIHQMRRASRPYLREVFMNAEATIFVSRDLLAAARARGLSPSQPHVISNGFDGSVFRLAPTRRPGPPRLLFAGTLSRVKGADRLPGLMQEVWRLDPNACLSVAGEGPLAGALRDIKDPRVRLLGPQSHMDLAALMGDSDVLVVPSRNEGWGCVVKEAQATGTYVVANAVGGLRESVGEGGELVDMGGGWSVGDFAAASVRGVGRMDRSSVAASADGFTWENVVTEELKVFAAAVATG